jgi:hypothetical protein
MMHIEVGSPIRGQGTPPNHRGGSARDSFSSACEMGHVGKGGAVGSESQGLVNLHGLRVRVGMGMGMG